MHEVRPKGQHHWGLRFVHTPEASSKTGAHRGSVGLGGDLRHQHPVIESCATITSKHRELTHPRRHMQRATVTTVRLNPVHIPRQSEGLCRHCVCPAQALHLLQLTPREKRGSSKSLHAWLRPTCEPLSNPCKLGSAR